MSKNIRLVNMSGKYKLYYVELDEDGYVDKVGDEVAFIGRDTKEMRELVAMAVAALGYSDIVVNAGNRDMLMGRSDG